jgi:hypothetical protein
VLVYLFEPSFALSHFISCACCAGLTVVLFLFCASTKLGAIQLKSEKKKQRAMEEQAVIAAMDLQMEQQEMAQKLQTRIAQTGAANSRPGVPSQMSLRLQQQQQLQKQQQQQPPQQAVFASDDSSLDDSSNRGGTSRLVSHMSSTFDFDSEEADDRIREMRTHEISYPVQQPRSLSFLRSRNYPDAEIHAETNSVRL